MVHKKKPQLPTAGDAFAFPLGDGRFSVCRVLLDTSSERSKEWWDGDTILVACSSWIGEEIPRADNPALRPILHLKHHSYHNQPNVLWISEEPPQELIPIDTIEPTMEEQAIPCMTFGRWTHLTREPLAQWRWDNEREAVLAEDVIEQKKYEEAWLKARREREQYLERITLEELRGHRFFPNWKDYPPPTQKAVRAARKVMTNTVEELLELGPRASERTDGYLATVHRIIQRAGCRNGVHLNRRARRHLQRIRGHRSCVWVRCSQRLGREVARLVDSPHIQALHQTSHAIEVCRASTPCPA